MSVELLRVSNTAFAACLYAAVQRDFSPFRGRERVMNKFGKVGLVKNLDLTGVELSIRRNERVGFMSNGARVRVYGDVKADFEYQVRDWPLQKFRTKAASITGQDASCLVSVRDIVLGGPSLASARVAATGEVSGFWFPKDGKLHGFTAGLALTISAVISNPMVGFLAAWQRAAFPLSVGPLEQLVGPIPPPLADAPVPEVRMQFTSTEMILTRT